MQTRRHAARDRAVRRQRAGAEGPLRRVASTAMVAGLAAVALLAAPAPAPAASAYEVSSIETARLGIPHPTRLGWSARRHVLRIGQPSRGVRRVTLSERPRGPVRPYARRSRGLATRAYNRADGLDATCSVREAAAAPTTRAGRLPADRAPGPALRLVGAARARRRPDGRPDRRRPAPARLHRRPWPTDERPGPRRWRSRSERACAPGPPCGQRCPAPLPAAPIATSAFAPVEPLTRRASPTSPRRDELHHQRLRGRGAGRRLPRPDTELEPLRARPRIGQAATGTGRTRRARNFAFSEPTGLGYNPATSRLFISDDDADRVNVLRARVRTAGTAPPTTDLRRDTASARPAFGSVDAEGVEFDPGDRPPLHLRRVRTRGLRDRAGRRDLRRCPTTS